MAFFVTPGGEQVEARGAMAKLFSRRGWSEVEGSELAPPRNASRNAWADYAESLGFPTEGLSRKEIIAALDLQL